MINIKTYNIFDLNQLKLEGNFDDALIYSDDTTLTIKGYSHIDSPLNLCWYTEDIFNHSYFKYRTQNNLTGLEVEFEIDTTNCISYQDEINNPLNLIIDFNESEAIKIPLGFFSNTDIYSKSMVFDGELGKEYLLKSGVTFIKRDVNKDIKDNVKISWTYKEQNGELSSSEFDVDYDYRESI